LTWGWVIDTAGRTVALAIIWAEILWGYRALFLDDWACGIQINTGLGRF